MKNTFFFVIVFGVLASCAPDKSAQQIIDDAITSHGGKLLEGKSVSFDFRNKHYTLERNEDTITYIRSFSDDSLGRIKDVLVNSTDFSRYANDTLLNVGEEWEKRYRGSVNSVLYFFQLPLGLNDPAVNKKYLGQSIVNKQLYEKVQVTFGQENGGEYFQDVFVYWLHANNKTMDYLAYSYLTDGGGVRFRQAVNRRVIEGIIVQDYINFKPENKRTSVQSLDGKFNEGSLIELSQILNENVVVE